MKFLNKHILVTSFACLLFSWQVNTASQSGSENEANELFAGSGSSSTASNGQNDNIHVCSDSHLMKIPVENDIQSETALIAVVANSDGVFLSQKMLIPECQLEVLKNFMILANAYKYFEIPCITFDNFQSEIFEEYFEKHSATFLLTATYAVISTKESFRCNFSMLLKSEEDLRKHNKYLKYAHDRKFNSYGTVIRVSYHGRFNKIQFEEKKIENIQDKILSIGKKSLSRFEIFHSKIDELIMEPNDIFEKIMISPEMRVCGDVSRDVFIKTFLNFQCSLAENTDRNSHPSVMLNLFSSPPNQAQHVELFKEKQDTVDYITFELYICDTANSINVFKEKTLKGESIFLKVPLRNCDNIEILSKALEYDKIIGIELDFYYCFHKFKELFEAIKNKQFKMVTINSYHDTPGHKKFIRDLLHESFFWSNIETLGLIRFSFNSIYSTLKAVRSLSPQLKRLHLDLSDRICIKHSRIKKKRLHNRTRKIYIPSKKEMFAKLKLPSLSELHIKILHRRKHSKDIEALLLISTKLEKLSVSIDGNLETFEIENQSIKQIEIDCRELKNELEFVWKMINLQQLSSVDIKQQWNNILTWRQSGGRVYYNFIIEKWFSHFAKKYEAWKSKPQDLRIQSVEDYLQNENKKHP